MASCAIILLMVGGANGYSVDFYDCRSPTRMERFVRPTACDALPAVEEQPMGKSFEVLTEATTRELSCWSCEIITSEWRYCCGIFSHLKLASVPHPMRHAQLSLAECRRILHRMEYTMQGRVKSMPLRLNTWNSFSMTVSGDLEAYPDHVECQGEETRDGDKLTENEIVLQELRIMLSDEHFLANHGRIENKGEYLQLPCTVRESGCQTSRKTYIWEDRAGDCQLHQIRMVTPNRTKGTWLVDQHHQLLLKVTGVYPITGCKLALKTSQVDYIYLAELTDKEMQNIIYGLPQMPARKVDLQINTALAIDYTVYQLTNLSLHMFFVA